MNGPKAAGPSDQFRMFIGGAVALIGLAIAYGVFKSASDQLGIKDLPDPAATRIVTLGSAVMTLVGTLVGVFVGVQVGSQGLASSEAARVGVERIAQTLAGAASMPHATPPAAAAPENHGPVAGSFREVRSPVGDAANVVPGPPNKPV